MISLAVKNIIKNKKNSLIIILLISVITFLFFIGNTIIGKAAVSVRKSYIDSLTGEVVLQKKGDVTMNLFGANAAIINEYFDIPILPSYNEIYGILKQEKDVLSFSSQVSGAAYMDYLNFRYPVLLCGVDPGTYFELFSGIILLEGNFIKHGEFGLLINEDIADKIEKQNGKRPVIDSPVLFTSGGSMGFKLREIPIKGIFKYENPGQFMNNIVIMDPQTVRELNSININPVIETEIPDNFLLSDIDQLFSENFETELSLETGEFSQDYLKQYLQNNHEELTMQTHGDWNFILIRLKKGVNISSFINSINKKVNPYNVMAVDWRIASGTSSIITLLVQFLFNAGIFFISITGVIAIINIFLIFVFRRVKEIGTLRAIGAQNSFIRKLIYTENIIYSSVSGIIGIILGVFFISFVNSLNIGINNNILISLFNGNILHFSFIPPVALFSFFLAVIIGITSSVYPVEIAVKIKPVVAVQRG